MPKLSLSIGLMSGTSMDGIDAALIATDGIYEIQELGHCSLSYDPLFKIALKAAESSVKAAKGNLFEAEENYRKHLDNYLRLELKQSNPEQTEQAVNDYFQQSLSLMNVINKSTQWHAQAVMQLLNQTQRSAKEITVVGYHGQTLFHQASAGISIIIGDGQQLANEVGISVVNDFRSNDIKHGGQGAPFAPLYHLALCIRDQFIPAAVVNCGGIANISVINSSHPEDLIAFDTGPGNGLIDRLVRQRTAGKEHMDKNGHYGQKGKVNDAALSALFAKAIIQNDQNYFSLTAPKALDIGDLYLIPEIENLSIEDACRTLEAFTAESLVRSLDLIKVNIPTSWILAGGGWNNPVILQELRERLTQRLRTQLKILTADEAGWNSQALEAQIFAYLAVRSLKHLPLSMPGTTGVKSAMTGGYIHAPQQEQTA